MIIIYLFLLACAAASMAASNPIVTKLFTADPAAMVHDDTVYIYTGHDEAQAGHDGYVMNDWYVFSSSDMDTWKNHGPVLSLGTFKWARWGAWASQTIERNGKFYWYVTVNDGADFAIGVAVADHPTGPFKDALGKALILGRVTGSEVTYDIDPTVIIDDDGQAYLYWGNGAVKGYRLKENMIEVEGAMFDVTPPMFTEAAFMHKRKDYFFLTYAWGWEERIGQATLKSPTRGVSNSKLIVGYNNNSNTSHQSFIEFHNQWYYIYHTGALGGSFRRAVCVDYAFYENDSTIANITMTTKGVGRIDPNPIKDGVYKIKAKHSGLYLQDAQGIVVQNPEDTAWSQYWLVQRKNGISYTIKNVKTNRYMDFPTVKLLDTLKTDVLAGEILVENFSVENGYRFYADTASEYLGDVLNVSQNANVPLVIWKQTGTLNQSFLFEHAGGESEFYVPTFSEKIGEKQESLRVLTLSRTEGLRFSKPIEFTILDVTGTIIAKSKSSFVLLSGYEKGMYFLKTKTQSQAFFLR